MKKNIFLLLALIAVFSRPVTAQEISFKEIFTTKWIENDTKLEQINRRCKELDLALEFQRSPETGESIAVINVKGLKLPIPQTLLETIYHSFIKDHPYSKKTATVRLIDEQSELLSEEQDYLAQRDIICHQAIESLLGEKINPQELPRIALCCSGGGFRAMFASAGLLCGLDNNHILDAVTYVSSLSGSTWTVAPWMICQDSFHDFYPKLLHRAVTGFLHNSAQEYLHDIKAALPTIANCFLRKLIFKEIPSMIDIYGYTLALSLFDDQNMKRYLNIDLTSQIEHIDHGKRPFPLFTAIAPYQNNTDYEWIEFSPYEVVSHDLKAGVPSWGYGRKFQKGSSVTKAAPLSLGFLMGLWGSATSISLEEVCNLAFDNLKPKIVFAPLKALVQASPIANIRLFPAQMRNYTYQMPGLPHNQYKRLTVIDAGIDFTLPLPPLLNPQRAIDIIIICDASTKIIDAPHLRKAEQYAQKHNLPFPQIDYTNISEKQVSIFDDGPNAHTPIVIYIPMIKSNDYSQDFDPHKYLELGEFMHTLNFVYSKEQAHLLSGLFEHKANNATSTIVDQIKKVVERKRNV